MGAETEGLSGHLPGRAGPAAVPAEHADDLVFPAVARLELDELLAQLVERAQDVVATQSRLRALLRATRTVATDLSLDVVLRRIVEAACAGIAFEILFAAAAVVVYLPFFHSILGTAAPTPSDLLLPMPVLVWGADELWRTWRRRGTGRF